MSEKITFVKKLARFGSQKNGLQIAIIIPKEYREKIWKAFKNKRLSVQLQEFS